MSIAIKVENLSKAYQIGQIGTGTISRDLERWWTTRVMGKEDPFLKVGETNDRSTKGKSDIVWSLKDINFEIEQGDAVGIIGKNGAGKSTLLKLLSRVTSPTTGKIKVRGRIASLLEVGTGFHPELTGRENIYLNGSILGMRKREIDRKLDEIIDFSGVERYIDTPVKRYSSGMYVRLAFAVAAHLESEILIVDEVLAVGDAEFQEKCIGKMGNVSSVEGKTILFVSHNMSSVQSLCDKSILLENGFVKAKGFTNDIILSHLKSQNSATDNLSLEAKREGSGEIRFREIELNNNEPILCGKSLSIKLTFDVNTEIKNPRLAIVFCNRREEPLFTIDNISQGIRIDSLKKGSQALNIEIPRLFLMPGNYQINLWIGYRNQTLDKVIFAKEFVVHENDFYGSGIGLSSRKHGSFYVPECNWNL